MDKVSSFYPVMLYPIELSGLWYANRGWSRPSYTVRASPISWIRAVPLWVATSFGLTSHRIQRLQHHSWFSGFHSWRGWILDVRIGTPKAPRSSWPLDAATLDKDWDAAVRSEYFPAFPALPFDRAVESAVIPHVLRIEDVFAFRARQKESKNPNKASHPTAFSLLLFASHSIHFPIVLR